MSLIATLNINRQSFNVQAKLELPAQGITAIMGASGSGKTSVLRTLAGLERHDDSTVVFNQQCWQDPNTFIATHRRRVGYVFQEPSLFSHLNVDQNLRFGASADVDLQALIELFELTALLPRAVANLSGGEQQRVAIVRALAAKPQLLLLDEPLSALDEASKQPILRCLEQLHHSLDIPLIYVSHNLAEVARLADHLVLLDKGQVIATGEAHQLLTDPSLPLAHRADAGALIDAVVHRAEAAEGLVFLATNIGPLLLPHKAITAGSKVRLHIAARDVSVALSKPKDSSILNILEATVMDCREENSSQMLLRLQVQQGQLLARLSKKSVTDLQLEVGKAVFAQVKGVALFT